MKQSYLYLLVCFVARLLAMTSLLSLPRSDFNATREEEGIRIRGASPLLDTPFLFAPGLVLLRNR